MTGAGSVSAPAFTFVNDTDTGFFRSASNELKFTTGGTFRVEIDNSGRLGFEQNPSSDLHVLGSSLVSIGIILTNQDSTPSDPKPGSGLLYAANDGHLHYLNDEGTDTNLTGSSGGGSPELLGTASIAGSSSQLTINITGSRATIVSNSLKVTDITVPSSGKVLVKMTGHLSLTSSAFNTVAIWSLLDAEGAEIAQSIAQMVKTDQAQTDETGVYSYSVVLTDLNTQTLQWAARIDPDQSATLQMIAGTGNGGPATMEVWSVE
jgi:hypothetical protein